MNQQTNANANRNDSIRIPNLFDIFRGTLANGRRRIAQWRRQGMLARGKSGQTYRRNFARLEALEPRLLLSADLIHTTPQDIGLDATLRVADVDGAAVLQLVDNQSSIVFESASLDQDVDDTVKQAVGKDPHLVLYAIDGVTGGTDAQASAHVRLEMNGRIVSGNAAEPDTLVASARAYINAYNRLLLERGAAAQGALAG